MFIFNFICDYGTRLDDRRVGPSEYVFEWIGKSGFFPTNDGVQKGDIITWENENGVIKHAAYHIADNLFFNKNGQTFFNPWKITDLSMLNEEWGHYRMEVYRKGQK